MYIKYTVVKYRIFTYIVKLKDIRKNDRALGKITMNPKVYTLQNCLSGTNMKNYFYRESKSEKLLITELH